MVVPQFVVVPSDPLSPSDSFRLANVETSSHYDDCFSLPSRDVKPIAPRRRASAELPEEPLKCPESPTIASDIDSTCHSTFSMQSPTKGDDTPSTAATTESDASEFETEAKKQGEEEQQNQNEEHREEPMTLDDFITMHNSFEEDTDEDSEEDEECVHSRLKTGLQEQTEMIQEIHNMLSVLMEDRSHSHNCGSTRCSSSRSKNRSRSSRSSSSRSKDRSRSSRSSKKKNRCDNDSRRTKALREIAERSRDRLALSENEDISGNQIQERIPIASMSRDRDRDLKCQKEGRSLHKNDSSRSRSKKGSSKHKSSRGSRHRGAHRACDTMVQDPYFVPGAYDPHQANFVYHCRTPPRYFKPIPPPPLVFVMPQPPLKQSNTSSSQRRKERSQRKTRQSSPDRINAEPIFAAPNHNPLSDSVLLSASVLSSASPEMQKAIIGEHLYHQIYKSEPDLAGRITGMLLESDNCYELLNLLESPQEAMSEKIDEVLKVLEVHSVVGTTAR